MLAIKLLSRLIEVVLMAAIAAIGIGVGLYCLDGLISLGSARPDRLVHLPQIRDDVRVFLDQVTAPGSTAVIALIAGIAAVVVALVLIVGQFGSRRERLLVIDADGGNDGDAGGLYARPRTITRIVRDEAESAGGVTGTRRPKLKLKRDGTRGKLKVRARRGPDPDAETVDRNVHARVDPVADPLHLTADVRVKLVEPKTGEDDS